MARSTAPTSFVSRWPTLEADIARLERDLAELRDEMRRLAEDWHDNPASTREAIGRAEYGATVNEPAVHADEPGRHHG